MTDNQLSYARTTLQHIHNYNMTPPDLPKTSKYWHTDGDNNTYLTAEGDNLRRELNRRAGFQERPRTQEESTRMLIHDITNHIAN